MRSMLLITTLAVGMASAIPAMAMPTSTAPGISKQSQVTTVRYRHHRRWMTHRNGSLVNGKRGYGPTENMSKTNGGRGGGS